MSVSKNTQYGEITVSIDAIAALAGGAATESYGVVGMASQKTFMDGLSELLKKENYSKGVVVRQKDGKLELDLYIVVSNGVKISEVCYEIQKKVKYSLEKSLELNFEVINVFVQGVKAIQ